MVGDQQYTGGFLGLVPDNPGELAVAGGDPPEQMHLTLLYLGDNVTDWPPEQGDRLRELVAASAPALDAVDARIMGHAVFNPDGGDDGDRQSCAVYLVGDAPGLDPIRRWASWVTTTHDDYPTPPPQHDPPIFHVTAGYDVKPDQLSYTGPVRFGTLRLALAGDVLDVPLGDQEAPVITETKSGEITFTPPQEIMEIAAVLPGPVAALVAEGKALNERGVVWVGQHCGDTGVEWAAQMRDRAIEVKRAISTGKRQQLAKAGHTLKGTESYPIETLGDLDNAYQAWGRAKPEDRDALKRLMLKEGRRLKASQEMIDKISDLGSGEDDSDADDGKKDAATGVETSESLQGDIEVKVASPDPRAARLRADWAFKPKLREKWKPGKKGDFNRLRRHLAKYVHNPKILNGLTANIHRMATGQWPGKYAHTARGSSKPLNMGKVVGKSLVSWAGEIETKAMVSTVSDDADLRDMFDGVDDWGTQFDEPWTGDYIADLGDAADEADDIDAAPDDGAGVMLDTARHVHLAARMVPDAGSDVDPDGDGDNDSPGADTDADADASGDALPNLFDADPEPVNA